jgi:ABC-2 type transport system ATP-binding protein
MVAVIRTRGLTKHYGNVAALEDLDLEVPSGTVFGYLGPNGAGKTTTIRLLTGLIRATSGRAEVLGMDVAAQPDRVQARIGYLPGDFVAYPDLTGDEYLRYLASLRGTTDRSTRDLLATRLELDLSRPIGTLSHGNRQKVGLVQAFMHVPELLVLDEPTAGLDPLMQQEFRAMVREARDAGRTVFLSSHILDEVEAVADRVAILREGRLVVVEDVGALERQAVRRLDLSFADTPPVGVLESAGGVREVTAVGHVAHVAVEGSTAELFAAAAPHGIVDVVSHEVDLEEVFLAYYAGAEG